MEEKNILKKSYKNFEFISAQYIQDCSSWGLYFRHKITGLEVFHLLNDDEENLFSFCFRTPIKNSTGAAHILEHSVLCGSKKYPLKEPFTNLMNQSMNTFLNAMTYPDKTVYPASSTVKEDYFNIMSVYGDAVFFPLLREETFLQEGHRLEFDEKENKYSIQGVVYNEMKGAYSNFDSVATDEIINSLFQNTNYAFDSGGDPLKIPTFTYQDFKDFHKKYYRPSNCLVFLYGNISTEEQLDFIQENFLNPFEKDSSYQFYNSKNPVIEEEIKKMEEPDSISSYDVIYKTAPALKKVGQNVSVNWRCDKNENLLSKLETVFINEILTSHDGSPLSKALIDSGLGDDSINSSGILFDFRETVVNYGLHGVKKGNEQKVFDLIFAELKKIAENGVSSKIVDSILMAIEFSNREIIRVDGPYSLVYLERVLNSWNYGAPPSDGLKYRETFEIIKNNYKNDKNYVQNLVKKFFLENKNYSLLCVVPDEDFHKKREKIENEIILQKRTEISNEKILSDLKKMHNLQSKKETEEECACVKFISPEKLSREGRKISYKIKTFLDIQKNDFSCVEFEQNTNGISYIFAGFPLDFLDLQDYEFLNFYSYCVTEVGLKNKSWSECAEDVASVSGGISTRLVSSDKFETENSKLFDESVKNINCTGRDWILFNLKTLAEKTESSLKVFSQYFNLVDFSDEKRLKNLLDEYISSFKSLVVSQGGRYALKRAKRTSSHAASFSEITTGISQLYTTKKLSKMKISKLQKKLIEIHKKVLSSGSMIFVISDKNSLQIFENNLQNFINSSNLKNLTQKNQIDEVAFKNLTILPNQIENPLVELFNIPTQVGYSAFGLPQKRICTKENAAQVILAKYLSGSLLWEKIRTQGGAYGANALTAGTNDGFFCTTYRDPNPEKSIEIIKECLKIASNITLSDSELKKILTGNYSDATQPHSPYENGWIGIYRFLNSFTDADKKNLINLELDVTQQDLKKCAKDLYDLSLSKENVKVAIVKDKTKKSKKNTGIIVNLPL